MKQLTKYLLLAAVGVLLLDGFFTIFAASSYTPAAFYRYVFAPSNGYVTVYSLTPVDLNHRNPGGTVVPDFAYFGSVDLNGRPYAFYANGAGWYRIYTYDGIVGFAGAYPSDGNLVVFTIGSPGDRADLNAVYRVAVPADDALALPSSSSAYSLVARAPGRVVRVLPFGSGYLVWYVSQGAEHIGYFVGGSLKWSITLGVPQAAYFGYEVVNNTIYFTTDFGEYYGVYSFRAGDQYYYGPLVYGSLGVSSTAVAPLVNGTKVGVVVAYSTDADTVHQIHIAYQYAGDENAHVILSYPVPTHYQPLAVAYKDGRVFAVFGETNTVSGTAPSDVVAGADTGLIPQYTKFVYLAIDLNGGSPQFWFSSSPATDIVYTYFDSSFDGSSIPSMFASLYGGRVYLSFAEVPVFAPGYSGSLSGKIVSWSDSAVTLEYNVCGSSVLGDSVTEIIRTTIVPRDYSWYVTYLTPVTFTSADECRTVKVVVPLPSGASMDQNCNVYGYFDLYSPRYGGGQSFVGLYNVSPESFATVTPAPEVNEQNVVTGMYSKPLSLWGTWYVQPVSSSESGPVTLSVFGLSGHSLFGLLFVLLVVAAFIYEKYGR